jgi:predicted DNA-binding antitoxin AbrB/MazE fold protein
MIMAITIEAVYENGVLKPLGTLYLREQQHVQITLEEPADWVYRTRGIIPCSDQALIEWAAMDPDLEYDFGRGP